VASVNEIADGVRAALTTAATARTELLAALDAIEPAAMSYAQLGDGSTQPDLPNAAAEARRSADTIRQALATVDRAIEAARAWLASIAGPAEPMRDATRKPAPPGQAWKLDAITVDRLRNELPPPITATERGTGRKTHGRWVAADGVTRAAVSGRDDWSDYADKVFTGLGRPNLAVAEHVEMKIAARLRADFERTGQPQHASIVQNQEPCRLRRGCTVYLPIMLPEGCSLTIHGPNYRRTFTGGLT
jgi:SCP1.201-like deaminase